MNLFESWQKYIFGFPWQLRIFVIQAQIPHIAKIYLMLYCFLQLEPVINVHNIPAKMCEEQRTPLLPPRHANAFKIYKLQTNIFPKWLPNDARGF